MRDWYVEIFLSDFFRTMTSYNETNNEFLPSSFSMSIRHLHLLPIKRSRTCTTAMVPTESWLYITVKAKHGVEIEANLAKLTFLDKKYIS